MIDEIDAAHVVAAMFNREDPVEDTDIDALDDLLVERFGIDLPNFAELIERLLPLCAHGTSPLTGTGYRGFIHKKHGHFIVKTEVN